MTNKELWCSQEAIRNVREDADVVLYLVPAEDDPSSVGYVDLEMQILRWIGKPVIVLLNQTGEPNPRRDAATIEAWQNHLSQWEQVNQIIALDAFASCWVQERELLELVRGVLPENQVAACDQLLSAWSKRNHDTFAKATGVLTEWLTATAKDFESVSAPTIADKLGFNPERKVELKKAEGLLGKRSKDRSIEATNQLLILHELDGESTKEILKVAGNDNFDASSSTDPTLKRIAQGAGAGAVAGLAVDLPAGGMTFGIPTLIGTVVGAIGGLGTSFLVIKDPSGKGHAVRWSEIYFLKLVECVLRTYIEVAHHRRARGPWEDSTNPGFWDERIAKVVDPRKDELKKCWKGESNNLPTVTREMLRDLLTDLYPETRAFD